jgi:hypothetical protein
MQQNSHRNSRFPQEIHHSRCAALREFAKSAQHRW